MWIMIGMVVCFMWLANSRATGDLPRLQVSDNG